MSRADSWHRARRMRAVQILTLLGGAFGLQIALAAVPAEILLADLTPDAVVCIEAVLRPGAAAKRRGVSRGQQKAAAAAHMAAARARRETHSQHLRFRGWPQLPGHGSGSFFTRGMLYMLKGWLRVDRGQQVRA
jgi:hypothetical protein